MTCGAAEVCVASRCVAGGDGGVIDAGVPMDGEVPDGEVRDADIADGDKLDGEIDGDVVDGDVPDGARGDAGFRDAGFACAGMPLCGIGELYCDPVCVDALSDPANCGGCGVLCAMGEVCAGGRCLMMCDPPFRRCRGLCIDVSSDPDNCGGCGVVCPSGICIDGECSGPLAGHVVLIGHDYVERRRGMSRLVGNAVFLARGNPVRLLAYRGGASAASVAGTDAAIMDTSSELGRTTVRTLVTTAAEVPLQLANADALLVYAQEGATDAELRDFGSTLRVALAQFIARGGVVVVLDAPSAMNAGTYQILGSAGLLMCSGRTETTGSTITISSAADAVALRVPLAYLAERRSVRFDSTEAVMVARDPTGPVVIHRTVLP